MTTHPRPEPAAQVLDGDRAASAATGPPPEGQQGSGAGVLPVEGDGDRVSLEKFEGPLDLLLYLIREEEVDIYDIPISRITDQYLESIEDIDKSEIDLDRAGEFLLMAATLMRIKARMLIPRDEDAEEGEEEDPREELVRRLLEYRAFQGVAEALRTREEEWRDVFVRAGCFRPEPEPAGFTDLGVSIVDLFRAFRRMLDNLRDETPLEMRAAEYSVDERMEFLRRECLQRADGVPFRRVLGGDPTRALLIATFLGLLELIRLREVFVAQVDRFGEIWIRQRKEKEEALPR
jgi:segregation and condensation protein A